MTFKKSLLIALLSFGIANAALAETDTKKFDRARQYYDQQNYAAAFSLFKELAKKGVPEAQFNLASMYASGYGVAKSNKESVYWLQKAAEQGNAPARYFLATHYLHRGNYSKAKYYAGLACDGGEQKGCEMYKDLNEVGVK